MIQWLLNISDNERPITSHSENKIPFAKAEYIVISNGIYANKAGEDKKLKLILNYFFAFPRAFGIWFVFSPKGNTKYFDKFQGQLRFLFIEKGTKTTKQMSLR
jgi:hypothetical protein